MDLFSWNVEAVYKSSQGTIPDFYILSDYQTGKYDQVLIQNNITVHISKLEPTQYFEICSFYLNQNSQQNDEEIFIIEPNLLNRLSRLEALTIQLRKENKIIGCVILVIIPIKITKNDKHIINNTIHTTFLCIDKEHRKQGLAGILIRQVIEYGFVHRFDQNIMFGIHILQEQKYECPEIKLYFSIIPELNTKLNNQANIINISYYTVTPENCNPAFNFWNYNNQGNQILFYPSIEYFQKWCTVFNTYCIVNSNNDKEILLLFTLFNIKSLYENKTFILHGYLVLFSLNKKLNLLAIQDSILYQQLMTKICYLITEICLKQNIKLLVIPDMGNIPADFLLKMQVVKNDKSSFFGTYNLNFYPECTQVIYPYF